MPLVTAQAKGQMTVPQGLREALGIDTGTRLVCFQTGPDVFECHVLPKPMGLRAYLDTHSFEGPEVTQFEGPEVTQEDIDAAIEEGMRAVAEAKYSDLFREAAAAARRVRKDA